MGNLFFVGFKEVEQRREVRFGDIICDGVILVVDLLGSESRVEWDQ